MTISITYSMKFDSGLERAFTVVMDHETLDIIPRNPVEPPHWAGLEQCKCPNCTLDPALHSHCPIALNLHELIDFLSDLISYEEVDVTVESNERKYMKRTSLQSVASSLMGIIMVTSGCPILNKLRPMVETHLPFSTWEETTYRVVSMYLFAQYFNRKNGVEPDWDLNGLVSIFDDIEIVNQSFCRRLDLVRTEDSCVNAVNILSSLGTLTKMIITENDLAHWGDIFTAHYGRDKALGA